MKKVLFYFTLVFALVAASNAAYEKYMREEAKAQRMFPDANLVLIDSNVVNTNSVYRVEYTWVDTVLCDTVYTVQETDINNK